MAVAAVDRQRACRARQRDGKIQITVALNELIAKLDRGSLSQPTVADDHEVVPP
jgi:hypothetical protein